MHASAAGAKARRPLNAGPAVDMIVTESFLYEIVGWRSAIRDGDISGADIVTHPSPSGGGTSKKPGGQLTVDKWGIWIQI
jgi:hypothetical protein